MKIPTVIALVVAVMILPTAAFFTGLEMSSYRRHNIIQEPIPYWAETLDWVSTNKNGEVTCIEFGFRSDGYVLWRKGRKKEESK